MTDWWQGEFSFPTRVVFGAGRVRELGSECARWGRRPLIVTDAGVARAGLLEPVQTSLRAAGLDPVVFDGVEPNPTEVSVLAGLAAYRSGCDCLVAVGGGSPIDAAKAIRLLATHPAPLAQYVEQDGGTERIGPNMPALIALPTTAGTGSEVGRSTVVTLGGRKRVIFSPYLIANLAICDPGLTVGMPPSVTAGTGADALIHNLEAYFSLGFHPLCDAIAIDGVRRAWSFLPRAVADGQDLEARAEMMAASLMGAVAFQKGLGVVHSLAHPLSTVAGLHHGTANAVMLPHALRFNAPVIVPRSRVVLAAIGVPSALRECDTPILLASAAERLFAGIGLPARLREVGVTREMIAPMVELAMEDGCHLCNPQKVTRDDMQAMYEAAF